MTRRDAIALACGGLVGACLPGALATPEVVAPGVTVSTLAPCGSQPDGSRWIQVRELFLEPLV